MKGCFKILQQAPLTYSFFYFSPLQPLVTVNSFVVHLIPVLSGIRQDDILPPLPPERSTEQAWQRSVSNPILNAIL